MGWGKFSPNYKSGVYLKPFGSVSLTHNIGGNEEQKILIQIGGVNFPNLKQLNLVSNNIVSLEDFVGLRMPNLVELCLSILFMTSTGRNRINSLESFRKANLPKIQSLQLGMDLVMQTITIFCSFTPWRNCTAPDCGSFF